MIATDGDRRLSFASLSPAKASPNRGAIIAEALRIVTSTFVLDPSLRRRKKKAADQ
jgi:hypothetical protein